MFGLDARIALAIFGALSVISGAALYSAIQTAKAISILVEMQEVVKSSESYYLDTGISLPTMSDDLSTIQGYMHKLPQLIENTDGIAGWKGPYTSHVKFNEYRLDSPMYFGYFLNTVRNGDDWGGDVDMPDVENWCPSGQSCSFWVGLDGIRDENIPLIIDSKVDGGDGPKTGSFRWHDKGSSPWYIRMFLRAAPVKNPND